MTESEYGQALSEQYINDEIELIAQGRIPPWWPDGGDLSRDFIRTLTIIADDGSVTWSDARPNSETIRHLGMVHKSNASALLRAMRDSGLIYSTGDKFHMTTKGWLMLDTYEEDNGKFEFTVDMPEKSDMIGGLFT